METIRITDKCLPSDWLDEVVPEMGATPDAFLRVRNGQSWLVPIEDAQAFMAGTLDHNDCPLLKRIQPGEAVEFCYYENLGSFWWRFDSDRTVKILGDYPAHANLFGLSPEVIADTPYDAANELADKGDSTGEMDIWYWSPGVVHVLALDANGRPFFERGGSVQ